MIHIGITFNPNSPLCYSGANQTALLLAELCTSLKYQVTLIDYTSGEQPWFPDYPQTYLYSTLYQTYDLDLLIDIDGTTSDASRKQAAKKTIVFLRTFLQFAEMDAQLYIERPYVPRSMKDVHEIWCWDALNPAETIPSIQTMFPCPIRRIPFIWSSRVVEHYRNEVYSAIPHTSRKVHSTEKNTDNSSSCVLPIVALRELHKVYPLDVYIIHNMDHLKENKFLKENVLHNIEFDTLHASFAEKEPWYKWMQNDIILSHSRFTPLRIGLLTAVWLQIPLVHNSPFLREFHPSLAKTYYEGNSIEGIVHAFSQIDTDSTILSAFDSISIDRKKTEWAMIMNDVLHKNVTKITAHNVVHCDVSSPLIIAFDDMWPGFNYTTNFIMDALRHEQPQRSITGMLYSKEVTPHLLIFGPYSTNWKTIDVPKVYFSGENWEQPHDPSICLYLSSSAVEDATHMRVPTWMHFIDWYNDSNELPSHHEDNPIRMPLAYAMNPHPIPFEQRKKFCAFVVSNPICQLRNDAFHQLNQYKPVSSGGAYENNIGGQLHLKYPGGGCGDISKHHFFAEHKFTISFENSQAPGYVTEKLLHAKMAGCVPLYWGSMDVTDFVPQSFINLSHMKSASSMVEIIKKLEARPEMCSTIAGTPLLDESRKCSALNTLSAMSKRLLELALHGTQAVVASNDVIDKTYLINLDVRADRLSSFISAHPDIVHTRISAVYGKELQMSTSLYELCKHNTFQWKKSVIACALSHISVWNQIVKDHSTYTLILEDDVRCIPSWRTYVRDIPEDAELLYLGGVLPVNRYALPQALEKVNEYWSKLKPNTFFSKDPLPHFHFCAYSYILTKKGAQKLLDYLVYSTEKLCIPVDHLVGHPGIGLTKYIANTTLTTCFQEEDQQYNNAAFNELQTEKKFDSDIYNHPECFDVGMYEMPRVEPSVEPSVKPLVEPLVKPLVEPSVKPSVEPLVEPSVKPLVEPSVEPLVEPLVESLIEPLVEPLIEPLSIYHMSSDTPDLYEQTWLEDMFQRPFVFLPFQIKPPPHSLFLVQRPYLDAWNNIFAIFERQHIPFQVLHVSDEFGTDKIDFYEFAMCTKVIRNYKRTDVTNEKVITIPLGYHHKPNEIRSCTEKTLRWSFHGTDWFHRGEQLQHFVEYVPHDCRLQPTWNDPTKTKKDDYLALLGNSMFCPILRGNHMETFRMYEALEAGTLPVAIEANEYTAWIDENMKLSDLYCWTDPKTVGQPVTEELQHAVLARWSQWKERVKEQCATK